jgi:DNA helicase-2/ATP-dependent DNA helicase PcrA
VDFIEMAGKMYGPPGHPSAIVLDEAQDFTKLEMATLRQWAVHVQEFWVVGDEDQALYFFNGASADNMLLPELPPEQVVILDQSYRIPKSVHELAQKIINRVKTRMPKEYKPREEEGSVVFCQGGYKQPEWVVKKAQELEGESMILASCDYMLQDIIAYMRDKGVAFSNPWKPDQKSWNPFETKANQTLRSFLSCGKDDPYWDTGQLLEWIESLKTGETGLIRKQGKAGIKQIKTFFEKDPYAEGLFTCREYLEQILSPGAIEPALNRDVDWLIENVTKAKGTALKFPVRIFKTQGKDALFQEPKIHIGTIHSVKGAGATNVFIYPDISGAAAAEKNNREGRENLCRLFYVGITRTKKNLFVMSKSSRHAFSF